MIEGATTRLAARMAGTPPRLSFEPHPPQVAGVQRAFVRHCGHFSVAQLSACLVRMVEALGGTRLRPTGAVY